MKIIAYKKSITSFATRTLILAQDKNNQSVGTEVATLSDGLTYVSMPAATVLPTQPDEIKASVKEVALAADQVLEIKQKSPHVRLINQRVCEKIRDKYSVDDELKMLRIAPSIETTAYSAHVEDCRAWGQVEKAKLGL